MEGATATAFALSSPPSVARTLILEHLQMATPVREDDSTNTSRSASGQSGHNFNSRGKAMWGRMDSGLSGSTQSPPATPSRRLRPKPLEVPFSPLHDYCKSPSPRK